MEQWLERYLNQTCLFLLRNLLCNMLIAMFVLLSKVTFMTIIICNGFEYNMTNSSVHYDFKYNAMVLGFVLVYMLHAGFTKQIRSCWWYDHFDYRVCKFMCVLGVLSKLWPFVLKTHKRSDSEPFRLWIVIYIFLTLMYDAPGFVWFSIWNVCDNFTAEPSKSLRNHGFPYWVKY